MPITPSANPQFSNQLDELTTSSVAHPDTWNPTHRKLLENDAYLKKQQDSQGTEIQQARGSKQTLKERIDGLESSVAGQSEDADNMKTLAMLQALAGVSMAQQEMKNLKQAAMQQGEFTMANRGVVSGCEASKSTTATRNLNFTAGVCFARGRRYAVAGTTNAASVPSNPTAWAATVYVYLFLHSSGEWRPAVTPIGSAVPDGAITLYQITIPAGNTDATDPQLASITLTNVRRIEAQFPLLLDSPPTHAVAINVLDKSDYQLRFDVVAADGAPCDSRAVVVASRATNGFTVQLHSAADNVQVRWTLSRLSQ